MVVFGHPQTFVIVCISSTNQVSNHFNDSNCDVSKTFFATTVFGINHTGSVGDSSL